MARWARGHKNNGGIGWLAQAWAELPDHEMREIEAMAMTNAFRCNVIDGDLIAAPTTYPTKDCANIEAALVILGRGETCIVAGTDMAALRARRLAEKDRAHA